MRFTDIMLAIPPLAMALAITAVLSPEPDQCDDRHYYALVDMAYQVDIQNCSSADGRRLR